jgi:prepilin-type N-terminal cleavage/methylation domain-containing protein
MHKETCSIKNRGFTLMELMIVIAIIAGVVSLAMPYVTNKNSQTRAILRELTVLSRELHTRAKLQGVVYRLVIDLGEDGSGGKRSTQTFWVERASGKTVLGPSEEEDAFKRAQETDEKKRKDPRGFEEDHSMVKKHRELPAGLSFEKIELSRVKDPVTHGKAFIHYLPAGLVDEAAIHIKGVKEAAWTIAIHPLTGKAELISKNLRLQEIKEQ